MPRKNGNSFLPGYPAQYGYGAQPMLNPVAYVDSKGTKLTRTFEEINKLFSTSGDTLIGTNRTGIASGTNMSEVLDSIAENIEYDRGFYGDIKQYVESNTKNVTIMQYPTEEWTPTASTEATYTTSALVGSYALKVKTTTAVAGYHSARLVLSKSGGLDLTTFNDGSPSADDDIIKYRIDVNNAAAVDPSAYHGVALYLGNATNFNPASDPYLVSFVTNVSAGTNSIELKKSDFTAVNGGTFDDPILAIQCQWAALAGNMNEFVNFDDVTLVRADPIDPDIGNAFQRNLNGVQTRDFQILSGDWYVGESEPGNPFCKNVLPTDTGTDSTSVSLKSTSTYNDSWQASVTIKIGTNSYSNRLCWEAASDKRISTYVNTDMLALSIKWGSEILAVKTADFVVKLHDTITLQLSRQGTIFEAVATRNGNPNTLVQLSLDTRNFIDAFSVSQSMVINDSGYIGVGDKENVACAIYNIGVTTTRLAAQALDSFAVGGTPAYQIMSKVSTNYVYYVNPTSGSDNYDGQASTGAFKSLSRLKYEPPFTPGNHIIGSCVVFLSSGTFDEGINIIGINGGGTLMFCGSGGLSSVITSIDVRSLNVNLYVTSIGLNSDATCIHAEQCMNAEFTNLVATGAGGTKYGARLFRGFYTFIGYNVNSANAGVLANTNSMVYLENCVGSANNYGCYATNNSTVGRTGTWISGTVDNLNTAGSEIRT